MPVELLAYRRRRDEMRAELDVDAAVHEYEDTYNGRALDYINPIAHDRDAVERHHRGQRRSRAQRANDRHRRAYERAFARLSPVMQSMVRAGHWKLQRNLDGGWAVTSNRTELPFFAFVFA